MKIGRMTWAGFGLALIGWVLLIAGLVASETLFRAGTLGIGMAWRADAVTLGQTLIGTGFGFALVGTLRAGFGALTRFFDAVLQRSAAPRRPSSTTLEPEPVLDDAPAASDHAPPRAPEIITVTPTVVTPERQKPQRPAGPERASAPEPLHAEDRYGASERPKPARPKDRNYVILSDGSVEVETMFGTRVFATLDEAKDFIR